MPWSLSEARTAFVTTAVGLGLLAWAWWQSSGTGNAQHAREIDALKGIGMHDHATYTVVGVVAVMVIGIGSLSWVLSGRRAVQLRHDEIIGRIESATAVAATSSIGASADDIALVAVAGSQRYHRTFCLLVRGKHVRQVSSAGGPPNGLRPCEMCEP